MHTRNNTDYTEEPNSHHRAFTADEVQPKRFGVQQPFRQQPICAHTPALAPQQSSSDDPRYSSSYPWIAPSPVPVCPDNSGSSLYWEVRRAQDGEGQPMPQMKPSRSPAHPTPPPLFGAPSLCRGIPAYRNEGRYRRARAEEDGGSAWRAQTGNKTYAGGQADGGEPWPPLLLWTQRDGPRSARHSPPPLRKPRQTADPGPPPHLCSLSSLAAGGREERERSDSPIEAPRGLSERHREGRKDRERGSTDVGAPASPSLASPRPTITHRAADRSRQYPLRDPAAQTRTTTTTNTKTDFVQQDEGDSVLSAPPTIISASRIPPRLPSSLRHSHSPPYSPLNRDPTYPHLTAAIAADRDKNRESPEPVPPFAFTGMRGSRMPHASRDRGGGFEEHSRADRQTEGDKRKWGLREAVKEYRQSFEGGEGEQQRDYSQEPEPARRQKETEERSEMSALSAHCCLSPTPTRTPPLKQGEREVNHRLHSSHPSSASAVLKKKQMEGGKRSCSTPATTSFLLQNSAVRAPSPSMERVAVSISTHTLSPPCHGRPMLPASTDGSPVSPQQVLTPTRGNTGQRPIDNWRDGKWIRRGESWIWESAKWKFEDGRWLAMDWDGTASDQFGMGPSKSAANLEGALVDDDATEDGASPTRAEGDGEEEGEWRLVGDEWVYVQGEWAYRQGEWVAADDVEIPNRDGAQMNQAAPSVPSSDPSRDNAAGVVKRDGDADASVVADGEPEGEWRLNEDGAWVYECPGWVYVNGGWQAIGD
uniref:Uncharacterized protein n=1 Tax=Chromera velia CCMP2878 TaxID=1169474 RepID=A0A0G4FPI9_9ALVE|eukprot:Cvel_18112.t1-p1 / transcript=Cvel_18112.t1 / gene=Cvel_18112 / organism=Chromera_velia_CCMP2878 / gene_product=hypothetical protein / transcript_product=hypothetical protein / location=Cvel_scaffold1485:25550-32559(-) / protein_length=760 / sequence_SO=supercontig / SO=protein_coding / is_pseudo=false